MLFVWKINHYLYKILSFIIILFQNNFGTKPFWIIYNIFSIIFGYVLFQSGLYLGYLSKTYFYGFGVYVSTLSQWFNINNLLLYAELSINFISNNFEISSNDNYK